MIALSILKNKNIFQRTTWSIRYTREYFQELNVDRQQIKRNQQLELQKQKKIQIHKLNFNDKNPENYIKNLKIDHQALNYYPQKRLTNAKNSCEILTPQPKKQKVFISASKKHILTTLKKATLALKPIKKQYLMDALAILENSHKKVPKAVVRVLYNLVRHAFEKGLDPVRLYIHGAIIGKTRRFKGIRFHAKGKSGRQQRDYCQVKIIAEEKDQKQFFEKVGSGQAPAGFAHYVRYRLAQLKAGYQKISQFTGITTAKGRQQKREILKRKVFNTLIQNKKNKIFTPRKTIQKQIIQQQGQKARILYKEGLRQEGKLSVLKQRQQLLKKNLGIQ